MRKNFARFIFVILLLLFFPTATYAHENVSIKGALSTLEVTVEVIGSGRTYHITTYISNTGEEQVIVTLICMPGGGFVIKNQNEEEVYHAPKYVYWIVWDLTLNPGQTKEIYNETWTGLDDDWKKLPCGDYLVRGVVFTDKEDIFSEPVTIHLEKVKNMHISEFLSHFPLLLRFLASFNFI